MATKKRTTGRSSARKTAPARNVTSDTSDTQDTPDARKGETQGAALDAAETAANGDALFFASQTVAGAARLAHEGDAWRGVQDSDAEGDGLDARKRRPVQL